MESNRAGHRLRAAPPRREAGITLIGLAFLVAVFGAIGLAVLKIVPLYLERMKIMTVLEDVRTELGTGGNTVQGIRYALDNRFYIESVTVERSEVDVVREGEGYAVRIDKELREPFFADLWFVVVIDEEVQISR